VMVETTGDVLFTKKPKRVFHTQHQATVIVQADGDNLPLITIKDALYEALVQIERQE
jgi:hypothetical protein